MYFNDYFLCPLENHINNNYMLVMEYADGGSLRSYLKENFSKLTWDDKYLMAYQLACAVSCLHNEKIVHCDLVIYFVFFNLLIVFFFFITNLIYIYIFNSIPGI